MKATKNKPAVKPVAKCSSCGAPIATSFIRQCQKCCRGFKGL